MAKSEVEAVAKAMCMATGEAPADAWPRHAGAAADFMRKVHSATAANDRLRRVPIIGLIEDGGEVRFFGEGPPALK